ncbi:hypothetical protein [Streptomyces clavuligerus]|nr:hypothetical protein [Streptomyces clavuligerus]
MDQKRIHSLLSGAFFARDECAGRVSQLRASLVELHQRLRAAEEEQRRCEQEAWELLQGARDAGSLVVGGLVVPSVPCAVQVPGAESSVGGGPVEGALPVQKAEAVRRSVPLRDALEQTARERALEIVRDTAVTAGITHPALVRQLEEEKHAVYGRQVRVWLGEWVAEGLVRQLRDGSFARAGTPAVFLPVAEPRPSDPVPELLTRAYAVSVGAGGTISSQVLCTLLNQDKRTHTNASLMGQELVGLLREVGVDRPHHGKVPNPSGGAVVMGFTAETLGRAIAAYEARAVVTVSREADPGSV